MSITNEEIMSLVKAHASRIVNRIAANETSPTFSNDLEMIINRMLELIRSIK